MMRRVVLLAALLVSAHVWADTKISALPAAGPLTGSESIPAVQPGSCAATGGTCQTTPAAVRTYSLGCPINAQTGTTYTLVLSDANNCVSLNNAAANTVSIPANSSVAFPIGTRVTLSNIGAGVTSVQGLAGVTLSLPWTGSVLPMLRQFTWMTLQKTATDTWQIIASTNGTFANITLPSPNATSGIIANGTNSVTLRLSDSGDWFAAGNVNPVWQFQSTGAAAGAFGYITATNNVNAGPQLGVGSSNATNVAGCAGSGGYAFQPATGPCAFLDTATNYPLVIGINFIAADFYKGDNTEVIRAVGTTSIKYLDALNASGTTVTTTLGDSVTATSVTNVIGGSAANTQANGVPIVTQSLTAPTISSGFGTGASVTANAGAKSFSVNVGTGGTASTGVIGLPTAAHGWACSANDVTTPNTDATYQTGSSTTTASFTNYGRTTGTALAWTASDILEISCWAN